MKSVTLSGNKRAERGSSNAKILRKEGKVPAVLYGGKENIHFTVDEVKFEKLIYSSEVFFIDLDIDGVVSRAIIKDMQFDPLTDKAIHIDFLQVFEDKEVTVNIPVKLLGQSRGVLNGGKLRMVTRRIEVKGLPAAMPEFIEIDISPIKIGDSVKVGSLSIEGLTFLDGPDSVIVAVKMSRVVVEEEEEEVEEGAETEGAEGAETEGAKEAAAE